MKNYRKTGLFMIGFFFFDSSKVHASEVLAGISQQTVNLNWSIDNSHSGGLEKASEVDWVATVRQLSIGYTTEEGLLFKGYVGKSVDAEMTDKDWRNKSTPFMYKHSVSEASYWSSGAEVEADFFRFQPILGLDALNMKIGSITRFEVWDAYGLDYKTIEGLSVAGSVHVNKTYRAEVKGKLTLEAMKRKGPVDVLISGSYMLGGEYMLDRHILRRDLKKNSFEIISPAHGFSVSTKLGYKINPNLIMRTYIDYEYSMPLSEKLYVNYVGQDKKYTNIKSAHKEVLEIGVEVNWSF